MGTNYYLASKVCPHCGKADKERHIGKSSFGWCFSLHVYPEDGIYDLDDWTEVMVLPDSEIRDEYGSVLTAEQMLGVITNRGRKEQWETTPMGYESWEQFHLQNHSEKGPSGLLRHSILPGHCIKHGEGTWDCLVSDFS